MQQLRAWSTLVFTYFLCPLKRCSSWQPRARSLSVAVSVSHSCVPASPYQRLLSPPVLISSADCLPFFIGKSPFNALVPRHRSACWLFVFSLFLYLLFLFLFLLLYFVFLCARLFNRIFYRLFRCVSFSLSRLQHLHEGFFLLLVFCSLAPHSLLSRALAVSSC